jgi:hypothetical protein
MKKVIFMLTLSGLVTFGSLAVVSATNKSNSTELSKGGDKKKKKGTKESCNASGDKSKCCEKKAEEKKKDEQPK